MSGARVNRWCDDCGSPFIAKHRTTQFCKTCRHARQANAMRARAGNAPHVYVREVRHESEAHVEALFARVLADKARTRWQPRRSAA